MDQARTLQSDGNGRPLSPVAHTARGLNHSSSERLMQLGPAVDVISGYRFSRRAAKVDDTSAAAGVLSQASPFPPWPAGAEGLHCAPWPPVQTLTNWACSRGARHGASAGGAGAGPAPQQVLKGVEDLVESQAGVRTVGSSRLRARNAWAAVTRVT
jgi:hypothetical protein